MSRFDYDLFVIGAGSGGVRAARMAAGTGAKVAIAEEYRYGGTCVIRGCVPKKLLVYASHFAEDFEDGAGYGWSLPGEPTFDWKTLIENKDREIARLEGVYRKLLTGADVEMHDGRAVLLDKNTVSVEGKSFTAETILVATGGHPFIPNKPGTEMAISSNQAFHLDALPERIVIAGGGFIAVEFAGIFNGLGSDVTLVYRGEKILRGFDESLRDALSEELVVKGIDLRVETELTSMMRADDGRLSIHLTDGDVITADQMMYATGRHPNTMGIGLEEAGVALAEGGAIKVDEFSRSSQANIYAVGDVTNRINLTPVAIGEAMAFVDTVYRGKPRGLSHENVPSAVFSQPPIGTVGLSESDARKKFGKLDIYQSRFRPMKHTLSGRQEQTMMKLVVDQASQRVVGAHMMGVDAPEIIQGIAIAIKAGATKQVFDETVGIHPSAAEEFVTLREPFSRD
ncbi:glutathione-disulfide reductase [Limibacillus halophilus]|uniref:Glutathione reductase n=1 Tax=Limibacillus halophilus TaxID=1579333 RepID=A0A839STW9_9PROT|nr:glutathione-disulfide reductase [Limibacillus halophilus]MBB3065194.1 glutathione reductase (NADPH) [Limibacillus halophilus]